MNIPQLFAMLAAEEAARQLPDPYASNQGGITSMMPPPATPAPVQHSLPPIPPMGVISEARRPEDPYAATYGGFAPQEIDQMIASFVGDDLPGRATRAARPEILANAGEPPKVYRPGEPFDYELGGKKYNVYSYKPGKYYNLRDEAGNVRLVTPELPDSFSRMEDFYTNSVVRPAQLTAPNGVQLQPLPEGYSFYVPSPDGATYSPARLRETGVSILDPNEGEYFQPYTLVDPSSFYVPPSTADQAQIMEEFGRRFASPFIDLTSNYDRYEDSFTADPAHFYTQDELFDRINIAHKVDDKGWPSYTVKFTGEESREPRVMAADGSWIRVSEAVKNQLDEQLNTMRGVGEANKAAYEGMPIQTKDAQRDSAKKELEELKEMRKSATGDALKDLDKHIKEKQEQILDLTSAGSLQRVGSGQVQTVGGVGRDYSTIDPTSFAGATAIMHGAQENISPGGIRTPDDLAQRVLIETVRGANIPRGSQKFYPTDTYRQAGAAVMDRIKNEVVGRYAQKAKEGWDKRDTTAAEQYAEAVMEKDAEFEDPLTGETVTAKFGDVFRRFVDAEQKIKRAMTGAQDADVGALSRELTQSMGMLLGPIKFQDKTEISSHEGYKQFKDAVPYIQGRDEEDWTATTGQAMAPQRVRAEPARTDGMNTHAQGGRDQPPPHEVMPVYPRRPAGYSAGLYIGTNGSMLGDIIARDGAMWNHFAGDLALRPYDTATTLINAGLYSDYSPTFSGPNQSAAENAVSSLNKGMVGSGPASEALRRSYSVAVANSLKKVHGVAFKPNDQAFADDVERLYRTASGAAKGDQALTIADFVKKYADDPDAKRVYSRSVTSQIIENSGIPEFKVGSQHKAYLQGQNLIANYATAIWAAGDKNHPYHASIANQGYIKDAKGRPISFFIPPDPNNSSQFLSFLGAPKSAGDSPRSFPVMDKDLVAKVAQNDPMAIAKLKSMNQQPGDIHQDIAAFSLSSVSGPLIASVVNYLKATKSDADFIARMRANHRPDMFSAFQGGGIRNSKDTNTNLGPNSINAGLATVVEGLVLMNVFTKSREMDRVK